MIKAIIFILIGVGLATWGLSGTFSRMASGMTKVANVTESAAKSGKKALKTAEETKDKISKVADTVKDKTK